MARPERFYEWQSLVERDVPTSAGSGERLRILWWLFLLVCSAIFGRALQLEVTQGAALRAMADQPGRQRQMLPAPRGRILARDGSVLALDEPVESLAVHYRYLQDPPDTAWLRRTARADWPKPIAISRYSWKPHDKPFVPSATRCIERSPSSVG